MKYGCLNDGNLRYLNEIDLMDFCSVNSNELIESLQSDYDITNSSYGEDSCSNGYDITTSINDEGSCLSDLS